MPLKKTCNIWSCQVKNPLYAAERNRADILRSAADRWNAPSTLCKLLFETSLRCISEMEVFAPCRAAPASFSLESFAERDKHLEFLCGCVFSKIHPRQLKINTLHCISPDNYVSSPMNVINGGAILKGLNCCFTKKKTLMLEIMNAAAFRKCAECVFGSSAGS